MITPRKMLCPDSKKSIKFPYSMTPTRIVVHNTYNDASADAEVKYMNSNNKQVSFHFAVDDKEVVQGLPLNVNGWHAGDGAKGKGNREGIAIEICYSKSGGEKFVKAEKLAAEFIAQLLTEKGWEIDKVTKHQDYSGKYCPHRTLDMGWDRFLNMVKSNLNVTTAKPTTSTAKPTATVAYYPKCKTTYSSIVDALKSVKVDSSFSYRSKIAKANGIANYTGSAVQNVKLLNLLKQGKLKKV